MESSYVSSEIWILAAVVVIATATYMQYKEFSAGKFVSFKLSPTSILVLITSPILLLSFPIFLIFRKIVRLMLSAKYGSKFCGLLDSRDAFYNLENKNLVHILLMIRYQDSTHNFYDTVRDTMKKALEACSKQNPKILGAIRMYMGYSYILKDEINIDDCFKKLETVEFPEHILSKESLLELMEEYIDVPLPNNSEGLWDVLIGTQPVKSTNDNRNDTDGIKSYPIIFRYHHSFADGRHFMNGLYALFGDKNNYTKEPILKIEQIMDDQYRKISKTQLSTLSKLLKEAGKKLKCYAKNIYFIFTGFSVTLVNSVLTSRDWNILHGPRPTHNKHFFVNDDEASKYLQVIKKIKKTVPGSTFEDIIITAIAASFKEYFQTNSTNIPDYITAEVPTIPPEELLDQDEIPHLRNRLTVSLRKLPIGVDNYGNTTMSLVDLLQSIKKEGAFVRNSIEPKVTYTFLKTFCSWIPATFLRLLVDMTHNYTVIISNIPGPPDLMLRGGNLLEDFVAWTGTRTFTGIAFVTLSYGDRIRVALSVDKTLIASRRQARSLLDGVFKCLDKLECEMSNSAKK